MARNLTKAEKANIRDLYDKGLSFRAIRKLTGASPNTVASVVDARSVSEASRLAHENGTYQLSDAGRQRLSEAGKRACLQSRNCWTKPEREFRNLLKETGLGVAFPDELKDVLGVVSDTPADICFQYPIQRYLCDFVWIKQKVVFRIQGDYWHANPILYYDLTARQKANVRRDTACKTYLEKHGWKVCDVWESEIAWNKSLVKNKIRAYSLAEECLDHTQKTAGSIPATPITDWSLALKARWFKKPRETKQRQVVCGQCGRTFSSKKSQQKFCSSRCSQASQMRVSRPSKEELQAQLKIGWSALGRLYGVSDNAVRKWAGGYGLI